MKTRPKYLKRPFMDCMIIMKALKYYCRPQTQLIGRRKLNHLQAILLTRALYEGKAEH